VRESSDQQTSLFEADSGRQPKCNLPYMLSGSTLTSSDAFMRKMDAGLSERRLREEIGKLSCDELAAVLILWHKRQEEGSDVAR